MTFVLCFLAGLAVGINAAFLWLWLSLRRENRKAIGVRFNVSSTTTGAPLTQEQMQAIRRHNMLLARRMER